MLHAEIRNFDQLISIFIKRIRAKPIFKRAYRPVSIYKMFTRFFIMIFQYIKIKIQYALFPLNRIGPMRITTDVNIDAIIIDWI